VPSYLAVRLWRGSHAAEEGSCHARGDRAAPRLVGSGRVARICWRRAIPRRRGWGCTTPGRKCRGCVRPMGRQGDPSMRACQGRGRAHLRNWGCSPASPRPRPARPLLLCAGGGTLAARLCVSSWLRTGRKGTDAGGYSFRKKLRDEDTMKKWNRFLSWPVAGGYSLKVAGWGGWYTRSCPFDLSEQGERRHSSNLDGSFVQCYFSRYNVLGE
jgi:hypothetical protein